MKALTRSKENGSALVETAVVLSFLLVLAIGAFEWGMALRDWISVSSATREGARVTASAGQLAGADCAILEATAGSLLSIDGGRILSIDIYQADSSGAPNGAIQKYEPFNEETHNDDILACTNWAEVLDGYPSSARDNIGADRHWIAVRLNFQHTWKTGLFWWSGGVTWSDQTIILMEPDPTI